MAGMKTTRRIDRDPVPRSDRPVWREQLVQMERGVVRGVRTGSAFFVHFFGCSIVLATAFALGLGMLQWAMLSLCITIVLAIEMLHQGVKAVVLAGRDEPTAECVKALAICTGAVTVAVLGSVITIGLLFWQRAAELWAA